MFIYHSSMCSITLGYDRKRRRLVSCELQNISPVAVCFWNWHFTKRLCLPKVLGNSCLADTICVIQEFNAITGDLFFEEDYCHCLATKYCGECQHELQRITRTSLKTIFIFECFYWLWFDVLYRWYLNMWLVYVCQFRNDFLPYLVKASIYIILNLWL